MVLDASRRRAESSAPRPCAFPARPALKTAPSPAEALSAAFVGEARGSPPHSFLNRPAWLAIRAMAQSSGISLPTAAMALLGAPVTQIGRLASAAS
jgi:hypothetical protein